MATRLHLEEYSRWAEEKPSHFVLWWLSALLIIAGIFVIVAAII